MSAPTLYEDLTSEDYDALKRIHPELPLLRKHQDILDICQEINKRLSTMDDRSYIKLSDLKQVCEKFSDVFPPLIRFFIRLNFLRLVEGNGQKHYILNSRLDYDWALNIFSNRLDLLATGIYKFDDVLKGGLRVFTNRERALRLGVKQLRGFRLLVQGRPGSGKTTMSLQMISNFAAQGYTSIYLTAEQDLESLIRTLDRFSDVIPPGDDMPSPDDAGKCFSVRELRTEEGPQSDRNRECNVWANDSDDWQSVHAENFGLRDCDNRSSWASYQPGGKQFWIAVPDVYEDGRFYFSEALGNTLIREIATRKRHGIIFVPFAVTPSDTEDFNQASDEQRSGSHEGFLPDDAAEVKDYLSELCSRPFVRMAGSGRMGESLDQALPHLASIPFSWMVIDSSTAFSRLTSRKEGLRLHRLLPHVALMMLSEHVSRPEAIPTPQEASSDMTIELGERPLQITDTPESASNYMQRYLEVKKFRAAPFHRGKHPIAIKSHSLRVYRSIAILLKVTGNRRRSDSTSEEPGPASQGSPSATVAFGIDGLDKALSGGVQKGSVTVLSGPPGSNKAGLAAYFLTAEVGPSASPEGKRPKPRSLIYSFSRDRRSILNGMRLYVWRDGTRIINESSNIGRNPTSNLMIKDIKPGYLFPENFVEDLIDTLKEAKDKDQGFTRVVFDSFDNVHAGFPLMRMDQFLWKVIFQVCWDYDVSALLKLAELDQASAYYKNMASLVTGMADNVIHVSATGDLRVVGTETGGHLRELCKLSTIRYRPVGESGGLKYLQDSLQRREGDEAVKELAEKIYAADRLTRDRREGVFLDVSLPQTIAAE